MIKILLVDDQHLIRAEFRMVLEANDYVWARFGEVLAIRNCWHRDATPR